MTARQTNWAGNYTYSTSRIHYPETIAQLQELVRRSNKLRVLGSRHSFNDIADSTENLVSLQGLDPVFEIDSEHSTVTISAGFKYGQICRQLYEAGYALHNLASLPHISVAGACATATHGSGEGNGNLATAVAAMEIVTADGEVVKLSRENDGEDFLGAVVGLGALGVVTKMTLNLLPAFDMRQVVYENLPMAQLLAHFDEIEASAYSVSLFTHWQGKKVSMVWLKSQVRAGTPFEMAPEWFGATLAPTHRHPIVSISPEACTPQMGIPGPWYERMPHFRMEFTPSVGEELQSEYLVPRQHAIAAIAAIDGLQEQLDPLLLVSEVRTIAADDLWMSPCYQQPCLGLHFTWRKDWESVRQLLPLIEEQLTPFNARPHWGKLFTMAPDRVQSLFPRLPDFQRLLRSYDPEGKFRNAFVDKYIFGAA